MTSLTAVVSPTGGHDQQQVGPQHQQQEDDSAGRLPVSPGDAVAAQPQTVQLGGSRPHGQRRDCRDSVSDCCLSLLQLSQEGQRRLSGEIGEGIGDYDYNNANDTANFCPGLQVPPPSTLHPPGFNLEPYWFWVD